MIHDIYSCSNFGKLNYYLGAGAQRDGRPAKYPQVDFCKFDELFCVYGVVEHTLSPAHSIIPYDCMCLIE